MQHKVSPCISVGLPISIQCCTNPPYLSFSNTENFQPLFDKCSIWDNVWEGNLIFCVCFFFFKTGRRASTHGASGKRSKVSVIVHRTTSPLRMCVTAWHHKLCLSVCLCLSFIYHKHTPRMFTLRHNSYPQGTIQVWDFKNKKKKILLKGLFRSRIVCVYKSTWFS